MHPVPHADEFVTGKMGDMSPISKQEKRQPADFIVSEKNNLGDTSPILDLQQRLLEALQEQNNLLRENAHPRPGTGGRRTAGGAEGAFRLWSWSCGECGLRSTECPKGSFCGVSGAR